MQAADVRNTGGSHGADRNDRERDREGRSGDRGGSTAATNHVGSANEKERGQNGEIDYRKVKLAVIAFKANLAIFCIFAVMGTIPNRQFEVT